MIGCVLQAARVFSRSNAFCLANARTNCVAISTSCVLGPLDAGPAGAVLAGVVAADSMIMAGLLALLLGYGLATAEDLRGRLHWRLLAAWGWEFVYFACAINLSWLYIKYLL